MDKPGTLPISAYATPEPEPQYMYLDIEHFVVSDEEVEEVDSDAEDVDMYTEPTPLFLHSEKSGEQDMDAPLGHPPISLNITWTERNNDNVVWAV